MTPVNVASEGSSGLVARSGSASRPAGVVCLVLEYCGGGSLLDAQEAGVLSGPCGLVDLNMLWPLLMDVARGMAALHALGVCHGGKSGKGSWGPGCGMVYCNRMWYGILYAAGGVTCQPFLSNGGMSASARE
jgi:hypothetical protein